MLRFTQGDFVHAQGLHDADAMSAAYPCAAPAKAIIVFAKPVTTRAMLA